MLAVPSGTEMRRSRRPIVGRNEDEHALRDAILLTAPGDDPGPAGKLFLATNRSPGRAGVSP
ncbi:DUF1403 family protein [Hoeflea sp.]|uniref:DUF1403 family protein n=1 Tax=Hoeflea sp. TaxID=1940281 RepID=UPI0031B86529